MCSLGCPQLEKYQSQATTPGFGTTLLLDLQKKSAAQEQALQTLMHSLMASMKSLIAIIFLKVNIAP